MSASLSGDGIEEERVKRECVGSSVEVWSGFVGGDGE